MIDLNDQGQGTYQLVPEVTVNVGDGALTNVSVLPAEIEVNIISLSESETPAAP